MTERTAADRTRPTPGASLDGGTDEPGGSANRRTGPAPVGGAGEPARIGRNADGTISISDAAVTKLAAHAAAEHPDAGAAAARLLGRAMPGAGHLGVRGTNLHALPKTSVQVDRSKAFIELELAIRWPRSVPEVTAGVREQVRTRLNELVGLSAEEVHITVAELVTDLTAPPRVK